MFREGVDNRIEFTFQMGYGKQALKLLKNYYSGNFTKLDETNDDDDEESDNGKFNSVNDVMLLKISIE